MLINDYGWLIDYDAVSIGTSRQKHVETHSQSCHKTCNVIQLSFMKRYGVWIIPVHSYNERVYQLCSNRQAICTLVDQELW